MVKQKELGRDVVKAIGQEGRKFRKKIRAFDEILSEILKSQRTFFKTEVEMEEIIEKKIEKKIRELRLSEGFTPEELEFLKKMALISQRDTKMFDILCHWMRNSSTILGGFAERINLLCKRLINNLNKLPRSKIGKTLNEIKGDAKIISVEIKSLESTLNNKASKKKRNKENTKKKDVQ